MITERCGSCTHKCPFTRGSDCNSCESIEKSIRLRYNYNKSMSDTYISIFNYSFDELYLNGFIDDCGMNKLVMDILSCSLRFNSENFSIPTDSISFPFYIGKVKITSKRDLSMFNKGLEFYKELERI